MRAFREPFAAGAVGAERDFSVDDRAAQCAFGGVVRWFDSVCGGEGPECRPDVEQVVGEPPVPAGAPALGGGVFEQLPQLGLGRRDLCCEVSAIVVLLLVGTPRGEYSAGQLDPLVAEGLLLAQAVRVAAKITLEMRPAHLPSGGVEMAVAVPAVRDHDPGVPRANQRLELFAVAMLGNLKERGASSARSPSGPTLTGGPPTGLIDLHDALVQHPVL